MNRRPLPDGRTCRSWCLSISRSPWIGVQGEPCAFWLTDGSRWNTSFSSLVVLVRSGRQEFVTLLCWLQAKACIQIPLYAPPPFNSGACGTDYPQYLIRNDHWPLGDQWSWWFLRITDIMESSESTGVLYTVRRLSTDFSWARILMFTNARSSY